MSKTRRIAKLLFVKHDPLCGGKHYVYSIRPMHQKYDHIIVIVVKDVISKNHQTLGFHGSATGQVMDWKPLMKLERVKCPWAVLWRLGYQVKKERRDYDGRDHQKSFVR